MDTLPTPWRPVPSHRIDGWTPARQWAFLQNLADCGSVDRAAQAVGMTKQAAYRLRRHPAADGFRAAWDAAVVDTLRRVSESTVERVLHGEIEVIERGGERITRHRPCAPQVVIAMLARCERLADAAAREAAARADLVPAQAAAAAAAAGRAARRAGSRGPDAPANLPPDPLSSETVALRDFHGLLVALPDSCGWEGPDEPGDDPAVPVLPMPEVRLCPDPIRLVATARQPRVIDPAAVAARAAARAEKAALDADMAKEAEHAQTLARIDRCEVTDAYGRTWGTNYC